MTEAQQDDQLILLQKKFDSRIEIDNRPGYSGYIIPSDILLDFCQFIQTELHYDYLSSITGVDYYPEPKMEVVYHVARISGGKIMEFSVQLGREEPALPSIVSIYPDLQYSGIWPSTAIWLADRSLSKAG